MRSIKNFQWALGFALSLVLMIGMSAGSQASTTVTPIGSVDGPAPDYFGSVNLWNGSGLSGAGDDSTKVHDNLGTAADMWVDMPAQVNLETVTFTLPAHFDLGGAYIWNYNQAGLSARGVKDFTIDVSTDGTTFTPLGPTFTLAVAPGTGPISAQLVPFLASNVVKVRFDILTNWDSPTDGSVSDDVGLSEVRFLAPEPASLGLVALGGALLLRRRRA